MTPSMPASPVLKPVVWTIAGSDSGGGAGIQADLATIHDLGCHGCSAITCITAQNSVSVTLVEPVSERMLLAQLDALLNDLPPRAIKIGLLVDQKQINTLATWLGSALREYQARSGNVVCVILDPVMVATCGVRFGDGKRGGNRLDFLPFRGVITLITPNAAELTEFAGRGLTDLSDCHDAAKSLADTLDCSVLAKGGDRGAVWEAETARDLFVCAEADGSSWVHQHKSFLLSSPRVDSCDTHGSGCTLSSAIASVMASGFVLHDAIMVAKAYVSAGIKQSHRPGKGPGPLARTGWPHKLNEFAYISELNSNDPFAEKLKFKTLDERLGVYPVVTELSLLQALLEAGAKTVQLRVKDREDPGLEAKIIEAVRLGRDYHAHVFINDHWELAIKHRAFGVHLGQEDLYQADLPKIARAGIALGVSSHSFFELLFAAQLSPSYIALGHIFATTTKVMPSQPQGLNKLSHYVALLKGQYPLVAIGGIDLNRIAAVKQTRVDDIAVVRAVTEADDPIAAYRSLVDAWESEG
ncbi:thiamine phosphate synthase [Shewanella atlantica]|uniref:thiamine phosphate synthase n=1 Tax=Shewanella atlantica TaxID=271099 RepID=UPI0037356CFC